MDVSVGWGVLGCARIAEQRFIPAVQQVEGAELRAIASRDLDKARALAQRSHCPRAYGSYAELLDDAQVDAVYIPLPNDLHAEWAIRALRAGKHVLCEKPLAMNVAEARAMQAAARECGRLLLEAFAYRFSPTMLRAQEIARSGALGELRNLHTEFCFDMGPRPEDEYRLHPAQGGGALYDVGCYAVNALRMIAGREPLAVWAEATLDERHGIDLAASALLDFGPFRASLHVAMVAPGGTYLRAVGSRGVLELPKGFGGSADEPSIVLTVDGETQRSMLPLGNVFEAEVRDMTAAVRGQTAPYYGAEPLEANMRALEACLASARAGGSKVAV